MVEISQEAEQEHTEKETSEEAPHAKSFLPEPSLLPLTGKTEGKENSQMSATDLIPGYENRCMRTL